MTSSAMRFSRGLMLGLAAAGLVALAGCGGGQVSLKGDVTYDGKPVEEGTISFEAADKSGPTLGGAITGGKYAVTGPGEAAGKKVVRIMGVRKTGRKVPAGKPAPPSEVVDEIERFIPPTYNEKSTLTADVPSGASTLDFHLKAVK